MTIEELIERLRTMPPQAVINVTARSDDNDPDGVIDYDVLDVIYDRAFVTIQCDAVRDE